MKPFVYMTPLVLIGGYFGYKILTENPLILLSITGTVAITLLFLRGYEILDEMRQEKEANALFKTLEESIEIFEKGRRKNGTGKSRSKTKSKKSN